MRSLIFTTALACILAVTATTQVDAARTKVKAKAEAPTVSTRALTPAEVAFTSVLTAVDGS